MPVTVDQLRKVAPEQFLSRYRKLWRNQKRELLKIVGNPPDLSKITDAHWKRWQKEQTAALLLLMGGYALYQIRTTLDEFSRTHPEVAERITEQRQQAIEQRFLRDIRQRSAFAARAIARTSRRRIRDESDPDSVFSDSRAQMITTTEMTAARSAAVHSVFSGMKSVGLSVHLVWRLRPCQHCEVCPLLDGTTHDFWSQFFPTGPPIHPRCCCQTEIVIGDKPILLRTGFLKPNPPTYDVRRAIRRNRITW